MVTFLESGLWTVCKCFAFPSKLFLGFFTIAWYEKNDWHEIRRLRQKERLCQYISTIHRKVNYTGIYVFSVPENRDKVWPWLTPVQTISIDQKLFGNLTCIHWLYMTFLFSMKNRHYNNLFLTSWVHDNNGNGWKS